MWNEPLCTADPDLRWCAGTGRGKGGWTLNFRAPLGSALFSFLLQCPVIWGKALFTASSAIKGEKLLGRILSTPCPGEGREMLGKRGRNWGDWGGMLAHSGSCGFGFTGEVRSREDRARVRGHSQHLSVKPPPLTAALGPSQAGCPSFFSVPVLLSCPMEILCLMARAEPKGHLQVQEGASDSPHLRMP